MSYLLRCLPLLFFASTALAQPKEKLAVPGLQAPVEVLRDQWGVNHIYAANQHDLFFAQGYCAARDRLFQFELWRRQATGTVAELLGPTEVKRDIGTRLFRYRGDLKKELDHYHPNGAAIINAYVEGVNAWIDAVTATPELLPFEFALLKTKPGRWTADVVISRHQGLLGNATEELATARAVLRVGAETVKALKGFHPNDPDLRLHPSITSAMLNEDILALYNASHRPLSFKKETLSFVGAPAAEAAPEGSNNWVVDGRKSASGLPLLANDPHRAIALPSLRYLVHLVAPGWNVMGAGEPTIPGVSIGHNDFGAWGLTIFDTDGEDLYVYDLNPQNLAEYLYGNNWRAMEEETTTIAVRDAAPVTATLRYTVHGPVCFIDTARRKAYAMRCAWLEPGGAPYLASLRMNVARNWAEFREACRYSHIPGENMVWADRKGNIGWQVVGIAPIRNRSSGLVPVPGDGSHEWDGYLDIRERPHTFNPKNGFIATANENTTPHGYPHANTIGFSWADSFRGNRIREVLAAKQRLTVTDMKTLQTDYHSLPARALVPLLSSLRFDDSLAAAAQRMLLGWNRELHPSSAGAALYATWERQLHTEGNRQFVPKEIVGLVTVPLSRLIAWLQAPAGHFGSEPVERRNEFLKQCFAAAVKEVAAKLGDNPSGWQYGKLKQVLLTHPLNEVLTAQQRSRVNLGPLPRGGSSHTPNATGGGNRQTHGASFRMIADVSDWDKTLLINTPGQSGDPTSDYYGNLFRLWASDGYFPGYFSRKKVQAVTASVTLLQPARQRR